MNCSLWIIHGERRWDESGRRSIFSRRSSPRDLTNQSSYQDALILRVKAAGPSCPLTKPGNLHSIWNDCRLVEIIKSVSPTNHRGSRSKLHWIGGSTPRFTLPIERQSNRNHDPVRLPVDTNQSFRQTRAKLKIMTGQQWTHWSDVIMQGITPSNQPISFNCSYQPWRDPWTQANQSGVMSRMAVYLGCKYRFSWVEGTEVACIRDEPK